MTIDSKLTSLLRLAVTGEKSMTLAGSKAAEAHALVTRTLHPIDMDYCLVHGVERHFRMSSSRITPTLNW